MVAREQNLGGNIIKLDYEVAELRLEELEKEQELLKNRGKRGWRLSSSILLPTGVIHYVFFREELVSP